MSVWMNLRMSPVTCTKLNCNNALFVTRKPDGEQRVHYLLVHPSQLLVVRLFFAQPFLHDAAQDLLLPQLQSSR